MKRVFFIFIAFVFMLIFSGCRPEVNLTYMQENQQQSSTIVVTVEENTNYVKQIDLSDKEEFLLNAFATGNLNNAVFEISTEDYTAFELKTYKFHNGQWQYTNNFCNGIIKEKLTLFAVEYYYLPDINFAFDSGTAGGAYHDDADIPDFSYTANTSIREWFEISEEETAFIAYRRTKSDNGQKLANTADFTNPAAVRDADENDEYYIITISFEE